MRRIKMSDILNAIWLFVGTILDNAELCYGIAFICFAIGVVLMGAVLKSLEDELDDVREELHGLRKLCDKNEIL